MRPRPLTRALAKASWRGGRGEEEVAWFAWVAVVWEERSKRISGSGSETGSTLEPPAPGEVLFATRFLVRIRCMTSLNRLGCSGGSGRSSQFMSLMRRDMAASLG